MPRPFPSRPNLEHFRKQAKQSLRDVRNGDGDAAVRSGRSHPRWSPGTDVQHGFSLHGARLLFASTSAIYGNLQPGAILHENDKQLLGSSGVSGWDYALSKLACEELTFGYSRKHHLRSSSVRLFNVIDARQSDRQVVGAFLSLAQQGRSSTVHGDGAQSLCFTDVSDAVEGLVRRADCDDAIGEVVNIGSRNEFTVNRLAEHVKAVTASDSIIESVAHDYDMVPSRVPCLSKVRQLIGYAAVHGVEDSIREIIDLDHSN